MTRKDYVALASALNDARKSAESVLYSGKFAVDIAIDKVADALASDNPRFDRARFEAAARAE